MSFYGDPPCTPQKRKPLTLSPGQNTPKSLSSRAPQALQSKNKLVPSTRTPMLHLLIPSSSEWLPGAADAALLLPSSHIALSVNLRLGNIQLGGQHTHRGAQWWLGSAAPFPEWDLIHKAGRQEQLTRGARKLVRYLIGTPHAILVLPYSYTSTVGCSGLATSR